jgi:hypothetical protein
MPKCHFCKKRTLMEYNCKCGGIFCIECKHDDKHNCKFNYVEHQQNELQKKLEKVVATKIQLV